MGDTADVLGSSGHSPPSPLSWRKSGAMSAVLHRSCDRLQAHVRSLLNQLKTRNEEQRVQIQQQLRATVEEIKRGPAENFNWIMQDVNTNIFRLVQNESDPLDLLAGIAAIDALLEVDPTATQIAQFGNHLRLALRSAERTTIEAAAKTLGRLAWIGGVYVTAEQEVMREMNRALEWLAEKDVRDIKLYASVLVLKELCSTAPALFRPNVDTCIKPLWTAIRDNNLYVREAGAEALRAILDLISAQAETRSNARWYEYFWEQCKIGLRAKDAAIVHGALICVGDVFHNTGPFLYDKFVDTYQLVFSWRDNSNQLLRTNVMKVIPALASYAREEFVRLFLKDAVAHYLAVIQRDNRDDRLVAFQKLADTASAVGASAFAPYAHESLKVVRARLDPRKHKGFIAEGMVCYAKIASMMGGDIGEKEILPTIDTMFGWGVTMQLVDALVIIMNSFPTLRNRIQGRLIDSITRSLTDQGSEGGYPQRPEDVQRLLRILRTFDFTPRDLGQLVRDHILKYLDDENASVRKEAALTSVAIAIPQPIQHAPDEQHPPSPTLSPRDEAKDGCLHNKWWADAAETRGHKGMVVGEVVERLLSVAVADPDVKIRFAIYRHLDGRFARHLVTPDSLRFLFMSLNDEILEIRELVGELIGRLSQLNPSYILPCLRRQLLQLLSILEHSLDPHAQEEALRLLTKLTRAAPQTMKLYVKSIVGSFKLRMQVLMEDSATATAFLNALAATAEAVGEEMAVYLEDFLPPIVNVLKDKSAKLKLEAALKALGSLVQFTGYAIKPYEQYPDLLPNLFSILGNADTSSEYISVTINREAVRVIGIIGALDPHRRKLQLLESSEAPRDEERLTIKAKDYFTKVVLQSLVRIMKDPSLSTHHKISVNVLVNICRSAKSSLPNVLPIVIPPFIAMIRQRGTETDLTTTKTLLSQLSALVPLCKSNIKQHLPSFHALVNTFLQKTSTLPVVLHLIAQLATGCPAEYKAYLPQILPQVLLLMRNDSLPENISLRCLYILVRFGKHLNDFLHQVIPAIMDLVTYECSEMPAPYQSMRSAALKTLRMIGRQLRLEDQAAAIIHPLLRVMQKPENAGLRGDIMGILCLLTHQLGSDYSIFIPIVHKVVTTVHYSHDKYDALVKRLLKNQPLPPYSSIDMDPSEVRYLMDLLNAPLDDVPKLEDEAGMEGDSEKLLPVNQKAITKAAWEAMNEVTRDGWVRWLRSFSLELLQQSPHIALRLSANLASQYQAFTRDLFNAAFVSVWGQLSDRTQEQVCHALEACFTNTYLPAEVLGALLNLTEFMDANDIPMPLDHHRLSNLASKTSALAKALRWKEIAFQSAPQTTIEELITIYNNLNQPESALGLLHCAEKDLGITLKESWYERLGRWEHALEALERDKELAEGVKGDESTSAPNVAKLVEIEIATMRCLNALGEWRKLHARCKETWNGQTGSRNVENEEDDEGDTLQHAIAPLATAAAWHLGDWAFMAETVDKLPQNTYDYYFHKAILHINANEEHKAQVAIDNARDCLVQELAALVGESYSRGYECVVQCQQLVELEEINWVRHLGKQQKPLLKNTWMSRLKGCANSVHHWNCILQVRTLMFHPIEDVDTWLKFVSLCRNQGQHHYEKKTLLLLLGHDEESEFDPEFLVTTHDRYNAKVSFAFLKHLWAVGEKKTAFSLLNRLVGLLRGKGGNQPLISRCLVKLGDWAPEADPHAATKVVDFYSEAMRFDASWYKAWHSWALANQDAAQTALMSSQVDYVTSAVKGYIKSITLGPSHSSVLQDVLRLLTLWFQYGNRERVESTLREGFELVQLDVWLLVIPQIIARVQMKDPRISGLVHSLLCRIGEEFPQALVYPLTVCTRSAHLERRTAAQQILNNMRGHSLALVEQCEFVSNELIRVAILWHEQWNDAIEEASKLYFGNKDIEGMLRSVFPLHNMLKNTETLREVSFVQAYGRDLEEAFEWCKSYLRTGEEQDINQAWEIYYSTFKKIHKNNTKDVPIVDLQYCSPRLFQARDLDIAVPGLPHTRNVDTIRIKSFHPQLDVMSSKQRPRKMSIYGSDGNEYKFLLKGHEDLRLDERVMQLFGLVNALLQSDSATSMKTALQIQRYPVIPLNSNVGLIGWVEACDTLHSLVKDFRERKKIRINVEFQHMIQECHPSENAYNLLPLINKVELFEYAMDHTTGQDIYKVLWLQSGTAEVWLDRRTTYTLSLATMSMVGYILGLGDRHPNNLMLQRVTGKIVHIDFGDCFEVAMLRDKFPERIPFRLTRMLRNAMEVSGIEGNFRRTCENVMRVLREHKGSVMAMLEAFVHDPLLQWRILVGKDDKGKRQEDEDKNAVMRRNIIQEFLSEAQEKMLRGMHPRKNRSADEKEHRSASLDDDGGQETSSHKGVGVMRRIADKLHGRDFDRKRQTEIRDGTVKENSVVWGNTLTDDSETLHVDEQVDRLINQAMSVENLCQCYIGWCPFW